MFLSVISKVVFVELLQNHNQGHLTRASLESNFLKMCEKVCLLFIFQQFLTIFDLTFLKNLPRFTKQLLPCRDFRICKLAIWTWRELITLLETVLGRYFENRYFLSIFEKYLWIIFEKLCNLMEPVAIKLDLTTGIFKIYYKTFWMVIRFFETVVSCSSLMSHNTNMNVINSY